MADDTPPPFDPASATPVGSTAGGSPPPFDPTNATPAGGQVGGARAALEGLKSGASAGSLPSDSPEPQGPSTANAVGRGAAQGLTAGFSDELSGLAEAGGAKQGEPWGLGHILYGAYKYFTDNPEATQLYNTAVTRERAANQAAQTAHPVGYDIANVAGSVAPMLAAAPAAAPTMIGRAAQAAGVGAGYGALTGAGTGEGVEGKLAGAGTGAVSGALMGAAMSPVAEGISAGVGAIAAPIQNAVRGATNPDAEAARRVIVAQARDLQTQGRSLSPEEVQASHDANIPLALMDAGGETTRALARSAANTSPEARQALSQFVNDRFETQAPRAAAFVDQLVGGAGDVGATTEALQTAARAANRPAYRAAYNAGSNGLWSPELERLTSSPAVVAAMKDAAQNGQTRAVADGFGGFNPGVNVTPDGRVIFNKGPTGVPTYPDLQFWDYTYRNLRDAGQAATQGGRTSEGGAINTVAGALRDELDSMVPQYQTARQGAARFFGAQDALEAGQQFVTQKMNNADAARAVAAMSPPERQLFMQGYSSQLINKINETGDRRNVANVFGNSPADRQRAVIALGPDRANQLEAYVRAERILDAGRGAVTGNSTTARQLAELGLAGGAYGLASGFDPMHPTPNALLAGALAYGAARGNAAINQRLAQRVGEMLVSDNPRVLAQGFQILGRNGGFLNALRAFDTATGTAAGTKGVGSMVPQIQAPASAYGNTNQQNVPRPPAQQQNGGAVQQKAKGGAVGHKGSVESESGAEKGPKATKATAHYRGGTAKKRCGVCRMFEPPNACSAVRGQISAHAVCDYFEAKEVKKDLGHNRAA